MHTALHWAGVDVPKSVSITSYALPEFTQDADFQHVGQMIFQLFKQIGDDYGQKDLVAGWLPFCLSYGKLNSMTPCEVKNDNS